MTNYLEDSKSNKIVSFFISYFHDEPDDTRAILSAVKELAANQNECKELYEAFESFLKTAKKEGLRDFVRTYANRNVKDNEQALKFIVYIQKEIGLSIEPLDN